MRKYRNAASDYEYGAMLGENLSFAASEAYKLLRTNLDFALSDEQKCRIIGMTSSVRGEGKSTTTLNLAYSIAEAGKLVLVIEADMRMPTYTKRLHIQTKKGISNLLAGQCTGADVLSRCELHKNMWVIPAGDIPPNPSELLGSEQMRITLDVLSRDFDYILLDLPACNGCFRSARCIEAHERHAACCAPELRYTPFSRRNRAPAALCGSEDLGLRDDERSVGGKEKIL